MNIEGTYQLESFVIESDGKRSDWGTQVHGTLIYANGRMSVAINQSFESSVEDSILFYAGTYQRKGNEVIHQVTEASDPSRIGKSLTRFIRWERNILELTSPEESFGKAILRWRKD